MDQKVTTTEHYRSLLKRIFTEYDQILNRRPEVDKETILIMDESRDQYILHTLGWQAKRRVWNTPLYVRLRDGKIWIEMDWIEEGIASRLLEAGVPKTDIVLAFHHPDMRPLTDFAIT